HPFNSNAIESLPPSHIPVADNDSLMEEIDLFLADDGSIPPGIESDDVDSVDDDTSISLPEFESFYVDYPNSGNSTIDVVEDIPVDVPNVLPTHPILEQDFIPTSEFFAYVVWIFLPFLAYPVIPPSLLSCGDEDTIFDPGISKKLRKLKFLTEGVILFLESLLYDKSSPTTSEDLQANSNAYRIFCPKSHIPVADNVIFMEEIDLVFLLMTDHTTQELARIVKDSQFVILSRVSHLSFNWESDI
ncbi:hypothetical protein Tco_0381917, partial [Tanacetum coccineum]